MAILGGGFSGAVTALHLLRAAPAGARIAVVEPRATLGPGLAYSANDPAHRINVPAARMTLFADDPTQFDRWWRAQGGEARDPASLTPDGSAFPARAEFGRYVAACLAEAAQASEARLSHVRDRAISLRRAGAAWQVDLAGGGHLAAKILVVALTHPPPAIPPALAPIRDRIIADPWADKAFDPIGPADDVVILGTGLTAADIVAGLDRRAHRGRIVMLSRRGLLSRGHVLPAPTREHFVRETTTPPATARALTRAIRQQVARAAEEGTAWQAVLDDVRAAGLRLWSALPAAERRRLVRHLRPFWDVHRFRASPQAIAAIDRARSEGRLATLAGSIVSAEADPRLRLRVRRRNRDTRAILADRLILATGPAHGAILAVQPALAALAAAGHVRQDAAGLGLDVDDASRAIGANGAPRETLFVAGPLARGRFGELMGLPQVSFHAEAVAKTVAQAIFRQISVETSRDREAAFTL